MFQYLNLLRKEGPQEWVHEECRDLDALKFQFKDKERAAGYVTRVASVLHVSTLGDTTTQLHGFKLVCIYKAVQGVLIIIIMIRFVTRTYPPYWVLKARIQKHQGKPLLFHDKCPGFFYVHYTTHGTYSFTSHPKDEAIMVKCLAQGHKRHDRPGRDSNSHSGNART